MLSPLPWLEFLLLSSNPPSGFSFFIQLLKIDQETNLPVMGSGTYLQQQHLHYTTFVEQEGSDDYAVPIGISPTLSNDLSRLVLTVT